MEAEYWEQNVAEAREDLPPEADHEAEREPGGGLVGELAPVAQVAPSAAMLEAFMRIEAALRQLTEGVVTPEERERASARRLAMWANRAGRLDDGTVGAVERLARVRNLVAHGRGDMDAKDALEFLDVAAATLWVIEQQLGPSE